MEKEKKLVWLKSEIKTPPFSKKARCDAGVLLRQLQQGEQLTMPVSRSMAHIGSNCHELRIHDAQRKVDWRIIYYISSDIIAILDIFEKKTQKTPKQVIDSCKKRLAELRECIPGSTTDG